jgi:hypothetical protein
MAANCLSSSSARFGVELAQGRVEAFVGRVDQHHAGHPVRMAHREGARQQSAVGMADQDEGRLQFRAGHQLVELQAALQDGARFRPRVRAAVAGARIVTVCADFATSGATLRQAPRPVPKPDSKMTV